MRFLCLYLVACSSGSVSPPTNPPVEGSSTPSADELGARAEHVLESDAPSRYDLPDEQGPPKRDGATEALNAACRAGHIRSCWYLLHIATNDDALAAAFRTIVDRCRHGDFWSCRALPRADVPQVSAKLPGAHGRDRCSTAEDCRQALTTECQGGFPYSCDVLADKISDAKERAELVARAAALSREGCTHGIIDDCRAVAPSWPEHERRFAYEQMCKFRRGDCGRLAAILMDHGDSEAAQREYERACQYGILHPKNCLDLGRRYLAKQLPEPVPGRGRKLVEFACAQLEPSERKDEPECIRGA